MFDAQQQASMGLKWPLIIDFSTALGSLIITGVPIWSHLYRITARCREMLALFQTFFTCICARNSAVAAALVVK
jgi:hypothetical protein